MKLFIRIVLYGLLGALVAALVTLSAVKWGQASSFEAETTRLGDVVESQRERISSLEKDVAALESTALNREARLKALEKAGVGLVMLTGTGTDTLQSCQAVKEAALTPQPVKPDTRPATLEARYRPGPLRVGQTGQSIRLYPAPGGLLKIGAESAELIAVDIHEPARGIFAGTAAALVAHFVHRGQDGKVIVVSVPLRESAFQQRTLWAMAQHAPAAGAAPAEVSSVSIDPTSLLPENLGYDIYTGALPVPPCGSAATFYRLRSPVGLSREQVVKLLALLAAGGSSARAAETPQAAASAAPAVAPRR